MKGVLLSYRYIILLFVLVASTSVCASSHVKSLQGYNWYSEKRESAPKKAPEKAKQGSSKEVNEELPEYEKNIRRLQAELKKAHRRALDNPTVENLRAELRVEKEMMRKSQIYGERRVAVAMLDSKYTDMENHSNVLHRRVQEGVERQEDSRKLKELAKGWGLILQVQEGCVHCRRFAPIVLEFAKNFDFQLLAASQDGSDFEGIEGVRDNGEMLAFNPERLTPVLFLVKGDGKEVWPISRGINSEDQIIRNIKTIDKHISKLF